MSAPPPDASAKGCGPAAGARLDATRREPAPPPAAAPPPLTESELRALNQALEERVAARTADLALLHLVAVAANDAPDLEHALAPVLAGIVRQQGWSLAQVHLPAADDPDALVTSAECCEERPGQLARFREASVAARFTRGVDLPGRVLERGRAEWCPAPRSDLADTRAAVADELGIVTAAALPILAGEDVAAVLEFVATRPLPPRLQLLECIGTQLGRIAERERAAELLRRAERLTSMGIFAAGIAHEVNNPLTSILMTARYALRQSPPDSEVAGLLGEVIEDAERCVRIIRSLLGFARSEPGEKCPLDLAPFAHRVTNVCRRRAEACGVQITCDVAEHLPQVLGNPTEVEQVLASLVDNAVQASRPGQEVLLRVDLRGDRVRLRIQDGGRGMTERERAHAFDPFFSGRPREGRSGLGLSLVHAIVVEHGGSVDLRSGPGRGTVVTVKLPAHLPTAQADAP